MRRQGLSTVVESVLLVLLTVVAVGILAGFLIPLVRNNLQSAGSCLDSFNQMSLHQAYTCKASTSINDGRFDDILISVKAGQITLDGIVVVVSGKGISRSYSVKAGDIPNSTNGISMYQYGAFNQDAPLALPEKNEGRTYRIVGFIQPERVQIAPIVNGEQCDSTESAMLEPCQEQ